MTRGRLGSPAGTGSARCSPLKPHTSFRSTPYLTGAKVSTDTTYAVGVVLASDTLVAPGFVTDFGDLDPFKRYLAETLDHRDLNEILAAPPTRRVIEDHLTSWAGRQPRTTHIRTSGAVQVSDAAEPGDTAAVVRRGGQIYRFDASHRLSGLPAGHQCARQHGQQLCGG